MPAGTDPAVRPEPPGDNRWQRESVVDALYLVDGEAGALGRVVPPSGRGRHAAMPPCRQRYRCLGTCGPTTSHRWRWPTSPAPTASLGSASGCRSQDGGAGRATKPSASNCTEKAGEAWSLDVRRWPSCSPRCKPRTGRRPPRRTRGPDKSWGYSPRRRHAGSFRAQRPAGTQTRRACS